MVVSMKMGEKVEEVEVVVKRWERKYKQPTYTVIAQYGDGKSRSYHTLFLGAWLEGLGEYFQGADCVVIKKYKSKKMKTRKEPVGEASKSE